jgi:DNA repair exonuclease SbcCD ATPase subunit
MIVLKTLSWYNMFSYGSANSLDLSAEPVTQLLGLNGHGKSSIPLIIEELLFNKNSKGIKKASIVNRELNTNKYGGSLTFTLEADEYIIDISRSGATQKVKLLKNGGDISSHTATDTFKQLESIMGVDFKTFSQIVYQNNTSSLQFLTATDTNRKKFLIDLLSLEKYVEIFEQVKEIHRTIADKLIMLHAVLESSTKSLEKLSKTSLEECGIVAVPVLDSKLLSSVKELKLQLRNIEDLNTKISSNNQYIRFRDSIDVAELTKTYTKYDLSDTQQKIGACKATITSSKATADKFSKLTTDAVCPTCCQNIDPVAVSSIIANATNEVTFYKQQHAKLTATLEDMEASNKKYEDHQTLLASFEKYSNLIDTTLPKILFERTKLEQEIKALEAAILKTQESISSAERSNTAAITHNAKIGVVKQQLEELKSTLSTHRAELKEVEEKSGLLEILKKAFSTNGLLAYKIENSVKDLQSLTNYYLTELSDGRFQLNFAINNDKLNVIIVDNSQEVEITSLSAGELTRVTTSTLLAIRRLMASLSKSRINILFLDETIDALDNYGREKLIEVLLKEELNTFLISHSYSHPLIKKMQVIKEQGISRIEDG